MNGLRLGRIAGFPIAIDRSWVILLVLVVLGVQSAFATTYKSLSPVATWTMGLVAALFLFASVLAHELMHSVVARWYGIEIKGITLYIFGGVALFGSEPKRPRAEFNITIAGPLTSFALGILFLAISTLGSRNHWPISVVAVASYLGYINIVLGVFNLVPGFPLDGGRVLRSVLWALTGNYVKSTKFASALGQGIGILMIAYGVLRMLILGDFGALWISLIGWFLMSAAKQSRLQVVLKEALSEVEVEHIMTTEVHTVAPNVTVEDFFQNFLMHQNSTSYPVAENGNIIGIAGLDEVRAIPRNSWNYTTVRQIALPIESVSTLRKNDDAWDAFMKLSSEPTNRLWVVEDNRLEGTFGLDSIQRFVRAKPELGIR